MTIRSGLSGDSRSGNALVVVLVCVSAIICFMMFSRLKKAEQEVAKVRAEQQETTTAPAPFHAIDEVLADDGPAKAADSRAATVRIKLSEMKNERAKLDVAVRESAASTRAREADIARLRNDIADAKKRIARLKAEYQEDPADEAVKDKLYAALVKLHGGEGVEGLETRLQRANAAHAEAKAIANGLARRLASLDSAIATAESKGQTVVGYVSLGEAEVALANAGKAGKAVDGLSESTEREALDVAAEDESAKTRRDAALNSLLEGL